MKKLLLTWKNPMNNIIKTGLFLGLKQIQRASLWTNLMIVTIMTLTFLNLVFVSGILVGLVEGSSQGVKANYSGDVIFKNLESQNYIQRSPDIINELESMKEVKSISPRILTGGSIEANYRTDTNPLDKTDSLRVNIAGISPQKEENVTKISRSIVEGQMLNDNDSNYILIGSKLLEKYSRVVEPGASTLKNVEVGDKVRLKIQDISKEFTVKGIVKSKVELVSSRVFMVDTQLRSILNRPNFGANEISATLIDSVKPEEITQHFKNSEFQDLAQFQTWEESQGSFFKDIQLTFSILGNVIGSIGLMVATITVFIVIFINALTRKRYIGILKGIGIDSRSIEISYVLQSFIYALIGSALGVLILFLYLVPFFKANPIDFPFSDGILAVTISGTINRVIILLIATILAGYIPAKIITSKNTLNAILGRD